MEIVTYKYKVVIDKYYGIRILIRKEDETSCMFIAHGDSFKKQYDTGRFFPKKEIDEIIAKLNTLYL